MTGYCHAIQIQQSFFRQFCLHRGNTTRLLQVYDISIPSRCQMAQIRYFCGNFIKYIQIQIYTCFVCNSKKVQYAVGRTSQSHITGNSIANRSFCDDISGLDVSFHQFHNFHTSVFCQLQSAAVYRGNSTIAGQCHTNGFTQTVHAVCSEHTCAGTTARTCVIFKFI